MEPFHHGGFWSLTSVLLWLTHQKRPSGGVGGGFLFPFILSCSLSWDFRCLRAVMPTGACENKPTNPLLKHVCYCVGFMFGSVPDSCQVILVDSLPRVGFV